MPERHFSGKYKLKKLLSSGAYAKVYHARDTRSGESVAIKSLDSADNIDIVEIQAMSRLNHPHVTKLMEVIAGSSQVFVITEFARCGDLFEMISKRGPLMEDLSRHYFQQLISAVKHCHSRGVFHRDIKPENILLDHKWSLKLSDFGLAAIIDDPNDQPGPILRDPCGTVEYAAPEVIMAGRGGGYYGAKADVWSCGVVLYVLCTGFLPFNGENCDLEEMVEKMKRGEFRLLKKMSSGLKWLLLRLLDSNPETRISVDEILQDPWFRQGYDELELLEEER
ncbi:hypothetical protein BVRB_6g128340 [Beta vulgaris subsp. vulgaris]|uniref:CBL-interacting serine/threonine-protein kinase 11 n=1 Tax=Beta vulgaris subsp. vulgaris TaxID=3555 RepID=UPI00053FCA63|nr:CBL-interacting serine/threonine-protein kinase 11 [Beta vulgaris subsp. vulgaris]KMT09860.1 hypothetical protein BVRB_6g128340 [Beta vulgaris subsp. vulgaris]